MQRFDNITERHEKALDMHVRICYKYISTKVKEGLKMASKVVKTFYGSTAIYRAQCPSCKSMSFVIDGLMSCCDVEAPKATSFRKKRVSTSESRRHQLPKELKRKILIAQDNKCIYCGHVFGERYWHPGKSRFVKLRVHYDHLVPWSYSGNNSGNNIAAACNLCNMAKSDLMFNSLDEARVYILNKRGLL